MSFRFPSFHHAQDLTKCGRDKTQEGVDKVERLPRFVGQLTSVPSTAWRWNGVEVKDMDQAVSVRRET